MQPTELTAEQIAAIRARVDDFDDRASLGEEQQAGRAIIHQDIPALLSHAEALAAKVARLEGALQEVKDDFDMYRNSGGYGL